jgi:type II secretory pathway pseudopilin PulG
VVLLAVAVPNFLRARKRTAADLVREQLRMLDAACDQYAIETNRAAQKDASPMFLSGSSAPVSKPWEPQLLRLDARPTRDTAQGAILAYLKENQHLENPQIGYLKIADPKKDNLQKTKSRIDSWPIEFVFWEKVFDLVPSFHLEPNKRHAFGHLWRNQEGEWTLTVDQIGWNKQDEATWH